MRSPLPMISARRGRGWRKGWEKITLKGKAACHLKWGLLNHNLHMTFRKWSLGGRITFLKTMVRGWICLVGRNPILLGNQIPDFQICHEVLVISKRSKVTHSF